MGVKVTNAVLKAGVSASTPEPDSQPLSNFKLDPQFEFVNELGQGKYGRVIAAKHRSSGQNYAIKKIANIKTKTILTKRCLREIMLLHHFNNHKNIICLYKVDLFKLKSGNRNIYFYQGLMETDLDTMIRSRTLSDDHYRQFIYQLLCGLKYIHSANVVHRDLNPRNLLVNSNFELRISNFGPAWGYTNDRGDVEKQREEAYERFLEDYIATHSYRAPEILLRLTNYGPAIDMWSVGCILGEMMKGKPIFQGENIDEQLESILCLIGTPSEDTLESMCSESPQAQNRIGSLPSKERVPLRRFFPQANLQALHLLRQLLSFDPATRITCEKALNRPYLAALHNPANEPVCSTPIDFDFEGKDDVDDMIDLISEKIQTINAETKFQASTAGQTEEQIKLPIPTLSATTKPTTNAIASLAPDHQCTGDAFALGPTPAVIPNTTEASYALLQQFTALTQALNLNQSCIVPKRLDNGAYVLTNVSTGLPIKPEYHAAKSNIICHKDDKSDDFKWELDHCNNVQPPADAVVQVGEHHFNIIPVEGYADTYTISTVDSGMYLGLSESVPGAKLVVGATGTGQLFQWIFTKAL